ncbi:MAG: integrase [Gammaproteobacteria bacterium]|nr:integrase [Gammaproteobacteria bacterium]
MSTMISEVYSAFRKAGVPEEDAKAAAEALSSESLATKDDIRKLDKELTIIKWMLGLVIVVEVMPLLKGLMI